MKDYIDRVPLKIKHKVVLLKQSRPFPRRNQTTVPETTIDVGFTFKKLDVSFGINRKLLRNFQIQRRIDLHGYTQDEAFTVLLRFLSKCQQEGIKNVLIITGGNAMKMSILRTSFKRWVKENFSAFVASYSIAKLKDGGQGAFYVVIREKNSS